MVKFMYTIELGNYTLISEGAKDSCVAIFTIQKITQRLFDNLPHDLTLVFSTELIHQQISSLKFHLPNTDACLDSENFLGG